MADIANDDNDSSIGDGAQVSDPDNNYHIVCLCANNLQVDGIEITETDDDTSQKIDMKCAAVPTCVADSGDHRKVVSHVFGRNKTCTRELPNDLWIFWCRKHYQRFMYRAKDAENWHTRQLELVRKQLQIIEDWGEVRNWTIALRKAEHNALAKEDKKDFTHPISPCWERFLVPYLGLNKTFAHIRQVLVVIEGKFNEAEYRNRDRKLKTFPGIEFLPTIQKAQEAKKPAAKKGEVTYKKITVDQPAFRGKGAANREYIKQMAAKKREASNTPESSGTSSKKRKSLSNSDSKSTIVKRETSLDDNATNYPTLSKRKSFSSATMTLSSSDKAFSIKRKSMTPVGVHNASPTHQDETPATKRRRLTRGYEKHGSDSDDATLVEKEHAQEDEQKIDL